MLKSVRIKQSVISVAFKTPLETRLGVCFYLKFTSGWPGFTPGPVLVLVSHQAATPTFRNKIAPMTKPSYYSTWTAEVWWFSLVPLQYNNLCKFINLHKNEGEKGNAITTEESRFWLLTGSLCQGRTIQHLHFCGEVLPWIIMWFPQ